MDYKDSKSSPLLLYARTQVCIYMHFIEIIYYYVYYC